LTEKDAGGHHPVGPKKGGTGARSGHLIEIPLEWATVKWRSYQRNQGRGWRTVRKVITDKP